QALQFTKGTEPRRFLIVVAVAMALTTVWLVKRASVADKPRIVEASSFVGTAEALRSLGLTPGRQIATISDLPMGTGGASIARLAQRPIVAQVNQTDRFWSADPGKQQALLKAFQDAGCAAVLSWRAPQSANGWQRLGDGSYSVFIFR